MYIEKELRDIVKKKLNGANIDANTKLAEAGLDSLDIVEIAFDLEEKFHIELPPLTGEFTEMTFGDLCRLIEQEVAAKAERTKTAQPSSS